MSKIINDDVQQLRDRVNIIDIIGEHLVLKKSGRTYRGLCPFHNEKTPSFHVDPDKQLYHCFGCGAGGDVFTFIMKHDGLDFRETLEVLARKTGYTLSESKPGQTGAKNRLFDVCENATRFYQEQLAGQIGKAAREYLAKRELSGLIERYRLGYSPDWGSLIAYMKTKKLDSEIMKAGIAASSKSGRIYDRFRGRLIFPITDNQGRPIAFGGRVLDDSLPKYLNSPETPLYHKGAVLYGLDQAKNDLIKTNSAIVVEGYTDALALSGSGIGNVVATLGTAFTVDHLRLLSRYVKKIVLIFDGDKAGLNAAERSVEYVTYQKLPGQGVFQDLSDSVGTELLVAVLPENSDPAGLIISSGKESFLKRISEARPLIEFLIDRMIVKHSDKKSGKLMAANEATRLIGSLPSAVAQEEYMRYLADKLKMNYDTMTRDILRTKTDHGQQSRSKVSKTISAEREFLKLVLRDPDKSNTLDGAGIEQWSDTELKRLGMVLSSMQEGKRNSVAEIVRNIEPDLQGLVSELLIEPLLADDKEKYFDDIFSKIKELSLERQISKVRQELDAIKSGDKRGDEIFQTLLSLERKRRDLKEYVKDGGSV